MISKNSRAVNAKGGKKRAKRATVAPPVHVLIQLHDDGFVEVFAAENVRIHCFSRLAGAGPKLANLIDEYHERTMPRVYSEIYNPRNIRASGLVERRTIEGEFLRREKLQMLKEFQQMKEDITCRR